MIECCSEKIWFKNKPKKKTFWVLFFIFVFLIGCIFYYNFVVKKVVYDYCNKSIYTVSATSINNAVSVTLEDGIKYSDLIKIEKDNNGNVVLMTVDSYKVNNISREVESLAFNNLSKTINKGVKIPILSFLGLDFLSGHGKQIHFKSLSVASVVCEFKSEFKSVGINQTLHSIYVDVICDSLISLPFNSKESKCSSTILISETIIVGSVPDIYLNGKLFS